MNGLAFIGGVEVALLEWLICVGYLKECRPDPIQFSAKFSKTFSKFAMGSQYYTLTKIKPNTKNVLTPTTFNDWMMQVRVNNLTRGCNKIQFNLFYGKLD